MEKIKLLYIEDEELIREAHINHIKANFNLTIKGASNGIEGLELYKTFKPDIIISDITMPKLDGLELIEIIRKKDKEIKIIIISAHGEQDKLLKAIELNLVTYMIKPVKRNKLNESIKKALEELGLNKIHYFDKNSYFDASKEELIVDSINTKLTKKELCLLKIFIDKRGQNINSLDIFSLVWDFEEEYNSSSVRTLVKKLRSKLPNGVIENSYGGEYKLI